MDGSSGPPAERDFDISRFDYHLPREYIAQEPADPRSSSRLMVLPGEATGTDEIVHDRFHSIADHLQEGDLLVMNESKVIPARLKGVKPRTGGRTELLLLTRKDGGPQSSLADPGADPASQTWECLVKGKGMKEGAELDLCSGGLAGTLVEKVEGGRWLVELTSRGGGSVFSAVTEAGEMPTPPYIKKPITSKDQYQTVYARVDGSVAAPTAGLHFDDRVFGSLKARGVEVAKVVLHVGLGTFQEVKAEDIRDHRMELEYYTVPDSTKKMIEERKGRLVAVGTTTVRTLESAYSKGFAPSGWTGLFIYPGYEFRSGMEMLLTNFHLPRSTLLMLVSAFAGYENVITAYREAILKGYRFYSFGDCMLVPAKR